MACKKMSNGLVKGKYEQICIYQSEKSTWLGCFDGLFMLNMRNRLKYVHLSGTSRSGVYIYMFMWSKNIIEQYLANELLKKKHCNT